MSKCVDDQDDSNGDDDDDDDDHVGDGDDDNDDDDDDGMSKSRPQTLSVKCQLHTTDRSLNQGNLKLCVLFIMAVTTMMTTTNKRTINQDTLNLCVLFVMQMIMMMMTMMINRQRINQDNLHKVTFCTSLSFFHL